MQSARRPKTGGRKTFTPSFPALPPGGGLPFLPRRGDGLQLRDVLL